MNLKLDIDSVLDFGLGQRHQGNSDRPPGESLQLFKCMGSILRVVSRRRVYEVISLQNISLP